MHFKVALPLLTVWIIALIWSAHHHISNQNNRLRYLAKGVQGVAERNAAMLNPAALARISCATRKPAGSGGEPCGREWIAGVMSCDFSAPCGYRFGAESRRVGEVLGETLKDLRYLPYFSELYKERVLKRSAGEQVFSFRVEVQRRLETGGFIQIAALRVPPGREARDFGAPVAQYADSPGALARAAEAWRIGESTEWVTPANYQVFWPIRGIAGTTGTVGTAGTVALLTIEVEREQLSALYSVGLVVMLSFWFIGIAAVTAATSAAVGFIWLFNVLTIWGVGLIAVVLILLFIGWRRGFRSVGGPQGRRERHKTA